MSEREDIHMKSYLRRGTIHSVACLNPAHNEDFVGMDLIAEQDPPPEAQGPALTTITPTGVETVANPTAMIFRCPRCKVATIVFISKEKP